MSVMEKVIPWDSGGGNLHLTYMGQGNGPIVITSDTENYTGVTRTKLVSISTTKGSSVIRQLTVRQRSIRAYVEGERLVFTAASGATVSGAKLQLQTADGTVQGETLKLNK